MLSMKIDGLDKLIKNLSPDVFQETFNRTTNDVVPSFAVETMKATKKKYNIGTGRLRAEDGRYVKPQTWYFKRKSDGKVPSRGGKVSFKPVAISNGKFAYLKVSGVAMPMHLFTTSPSYGVRLKSGKRKDIRVKVLKGKTRTMKKMRIKKTGKTEDLFRATMPNGHTGIFYRDSTATKTKRIKKKGKYYTVKYNPIKEANIITPTTMFLNVGYDKIFDRVWNEKAYKRFQHYLDLKSKGFWK